MVILLRVFTSEPGSGAGGPKYTAYILPFEHVSLFFSRIIADPKNNPAPIVLSCLTIHCEEEWEREKALMLCKFTPSHPDPVPHAVLQYSSKASSYLQCQTAASGYQRAVIGNRASAPCQEVKSVDQGHFSKVHSQDHVKKPQAIAKGKAIKA
ncbi:hypothetical protein WISP_76017 [Willisornis vidua]|uniref:Uncharacterized protein n=1 Tax=Willisornis vidua TaxID=1566151 RepID=A0ABQ9D917_9PASS|nr:hypothetical protein WISP_76017 [Willisornis vidua]